jgi:predicted MPP superfamily phosphohydrolase
VKITRRTFLTGVGLAATGALALGADATFIAPIHPVLTRLEIPLKRLPVEFDGFTIAQLSDFHYDHLFSAVPIRHGVDIVNSLQPDLTVLTGDFVSAPFSYRFQNRFKAADLAGPCGEILSEIRSQRVAVLGNHDYGADAKRVTEHLTGHGIPVMVNKSIPIERSGARIWIAGADDNPDAGDLRATLRGIPSNETAIALVHEPDNAEYTRHFPVDLQISGHSHGGQVRFPFVGPLYLPEHGTRFPWGLRQLDALTLYTNVGIGTMGLPIRLNCPPEVTLYTLRCART